MLRGRTPWLRRLVKASWRLPAVSEPLIDCPWAFIARYAKSAILILAGYPHYFFQSRLALQSFNQAVGLHSNHTILDGLFLDSLAGATADNQFLNRRIYRQYFVYAEPAAEGSGAGLAFHAPQFID